MKGNSMQSFAELFEASESGNSLNIEQGSIISGTVVLIDDDRGVIIVDRSKIRGRD